MVVEVLIKAGGAALAVAMMTGRGGERVVVVVSVRDEGLPLVTLEVVTVVEAMVVGVIQYVLINQSYK